MWSSNCVISSGVEGPIKRLLSLVTSSPFCPFVYKAGPFTQHTWSFNQEDFFITYRFVQLPQDFVFGHWAQTHLQLFVRPRHSFRSLPFFSTHENVTFYKRALKKVAVLFDQILTESVLRSALVSHFCPCWVLNRAGTKMVTVITN